MEKVFRLIMNCIFKYDLYYPFHCRITIRFSLFVQTEMCAQKDNWNHITNFDERYTSLPLYIHFAPRVICNSPYPVS